MSDAASGLLFAITMTRRAELIAAWRAQTTQDGLPAAELEQMCTLLEALLEENTRLRLGFEAQARLAHQLEDLLKGLHSTVATFGEIDRAVAQERFPTDAREVDAFVRDLKRSTVEDEG